MTRRLAIFLIVLALVWVVLRFLPIHVASKNIKPQPPTPSISN